ncbi:hypothetical protein EUGRSUZ_C03523 [Eucalyptus grandis]|uniref:Uncharacterized protein n=1 Tax=Eucalyptus grandis TaxID=71139 RepID=A0ACC3LIR8_EUCGR|nr:hypothetical protein EUGRSUZ_C03523 [Eucalyptus grandis]
MGLAFLLLVGFILLVLGSRALVRRNVELEALMEIKASLDPENKVLTSWTSNGDPCGGSFDGGLSGKVPPAVAQLKCLSGLYLHYITWTGEIPREISSLTELTDLYLDVNNLTGSIPSEIGSMASLQVLQLCYNQLNGTIPPQIGSLKKLSVLALQHNKLSGDIHGLANLQTLKRLVLGFNGFNGTFPVEIAKIPELQTLDVQNNSLSGFVPAALKKLERFNYQNNPGLCGSGFPSLRNCNNFDPNLHPNGVNPIVLIPRTPDVKTHCNQSHCSNPSKLPQAALVAGIVSVTVTLVGAGLLTFYRYRRGKQKIGSTADASDGRLSTDQSKDLYSRSASPLVCLEYSSGWDPLDDGRCGNGLSLQAPRYTLEEVESATQYFSEILVDQQLNPLIMDSGLPKLLADDVIYSALKTSAAMGYMAPEYITTGRLKKKILSGKRLLSSSMRSAAECCSFENFIDGILTGNFTEPGAAILGKIALRCTSELPDNRPTIFRVMEELNDWCVKCR